MTQMYDNIVGIDAAIFMHPTTWKASGHVDNFSDPMIDNRDSNKRYRVDHLIEAKAEALELASRVLPREWIQVQDTADSKRVKIMTWNVCPYPLPQVYVVAIED